MRMSNTIELMQIMMPLFICIITGFFTLSQINIKRKDEALMSKMDNIEKFYNKTNELLTENTINNREIIDTIVFIQEYLAINEETIKRMEIATLIMTHPDQTLAIEQLLENYNGNHYIYNIVNKWMNDYKVVVNPSTLNKLHKNSESNDTNEKAKQHFIDEGIKNFEKKVKNKLTENYTEA